MMTVVSYRIGCSQLVLVNQQVITAIHCFPPRDLCRNRTFRLWFSEGVVGHTCSLTPTMIALGDGREHVQKDDTMEPHAEIQALQARIRQLEQELHHREQELEASRAREARSRQMMDSNMVGVLTWHNDGRILDANDVVLNITGYSRDDLEQGRMSWLNMTPPEFMPREEAAHRELAERGVCTPFEKAYYRKDGTQVPILIGGAFLKGSQTEGVCFLLDISERREIERQLAHSQQLFKTFMDNNPAVAFIKNAQGQRVYLNRRYQEVFGKGQDLLGRTDADLFGQEVHLALRKDDESVLQNNVTHESILKLPTPDGILRTWLTYKFPVSYDGQPALVGGVAIDITELTNAQESLKRYNEELEEHVARRTQTLDLANQELRKEIVAKERAQTELRKSESRFRKWLDQSVVATQVVGPDGYTRQVNPAWERLWGGTLADITDFNLLEDPQSERLGITTHLRKALAGEAVFVPETPFVPEAGAFRGQVRWCSGVVYPVKDDVTGEVEEIVILHQDVTDRVAAEGRLQSEERSLRKLLYLQDQERKLIAYDIHDGLVQELVGAQMLLQSQARGEQDTTVKQASDLLLDAINEARRLINGLRPLVIDEHGVVNAIQFLIAEEEKRGSPEIHFFHRVTFDRLPPLLEGALFRIVQECLTNARRHSEASEVEIWLLEEESRLKLTVRDLGRGFDLQQVPDDRFGLESISKRAQIFGGTSVIESILGEGTTVRVEIPLDGHNAPLR